MRDIKHGLTIVNGLTYVFCSWLIAGVPHFVRTKTKKNWLSDKMPKLKLGICPQVPQPIDFFGPDKDWRETWQMDVSLI